MFCGARHRRPSRPTRRRGTTRRPMTRRARIVLADAGRSRAAVGAVARARGSEPHSRPAPGSKTHRGRTPSRTPPRGTAPCATACGCRQRLRIPHFLAGANTCGCGASSPSRIAAWTCSRARGRTPHRGCGRRGGSRSPAPVRRALVGRPAVASTRIPVHHWSRPLGRYTPGVTASPAAARGPRPVRRTRGSPPPVAPPWTARRVVPTGGAVSFPRRGRPRDPPRGPSSRPVSGSVSAGDRPDAAVQRHGLDPHGAWALTQPLGLCSRRAAWEGVRLIAWL